MKEIKATKEDMNNSFRKYRKTVKLVEDLKEETNPSTKYKKQVKELEKTGIDLKIEIEMKKKSQMEAILMMKILENRAGTTNASNTNRYERWKRESQS